LSYPTTFRSELTFPLYESDETGKTLASPAKKFSGDAVTKVKRSFLN
jgi:hypothetical protein